jgi:ABC-type phosphate/phosphonate transport system permease subunit
MLLGRLLSGQIASQVTQRVFSVLAVIVALVMLFKIFSQLG